MPDPEPRQSVADGDGLRFRHSIQEAEQVGEDRPDSVADGGEGKQWDSSNAVVLCDRCIAESGIGIADSGDSGCSVCGGENAPHIFPPASEATTLRGDLAAAKAERDALVRAYESIGEGRNKRETALQARASSAEARAEEAEARLEAYGEAEATGQWSAALTVINELLEDREARAGSAESKLERAKQQIETWERRADKNKSRVWLQAAGELRAALEGREP